MLYVYRLVSKDSRIGTVLARPSLSPSLASGDQHHPGKCRACPTSLSPPEIANLQASQDQVRPGLFSISRLDFGMVQARAELTGYEAEAVGMSYHTEDRVCTADESRLLGVVVLDCHVRMDDLQWSNLGCIFSKKEIPDRRAWSIRADDHRP